MMKIIYLSFGIGLLFLGGEALLRGCVSLARSFRVSTFFISAVIIGFGTSLPELTISVEAVLKNSPDIALGNVIGSNIANILFVVGMSAMISPISILNNTLCRDLFIMLLATIMLIILMWQDVLNFLSGVMFLGVLVTYICWSFLGEGKHENIEQDLDLDLDSPQLYQPVLALLISVLGLAALVTGASLFVDGALAIARSYGIPEAIIGLTLVAFGGSLPELATSVIASIRQQGNVVLGNIIGSNIFNILGILGVTSIVKTIPVARHMIATDIWVMLFVTIFISLFIFKKITIGRGIAAIMILSYISYLSWLYLEI